MIEDSGLIEELSLGLTTRVSLRSEKLCHSIVSMVWSKSWRFPEFGSFAKEALEMEVFQSMNWLFASESSRFPFLVKERVAPCVTLGVEMGGHHSGVRLVSAVTQMQRRNWWGPRDLKPNVRVPLSESQNPEEEELVEALV